MGRIINLIKDNLRLIIGAIVVLLVLLFITALIVNRKTARAVVNGQTFSVKVAKTEVEKQKGLSGKNKLPQNQGMVFVFDKPDHYSFWMKEMKFPIDIIYLNNDKVTTVIENATPPSSGPLKIYQPDEPSNRVLEINAGLAKKYNINKGSSVKIQNL